MFQNVRTVECVSGYSELWSVYQDVRAVDCVFQDVQKCGVCASECLELWSVCIIRMLKL